MDVNIQSMWNSNPTCVFFIFRSNVNKNKYIFALSHLGHQDEQTGIKNMPVLCTARVMKACIWWKTSARVFSKSTKRELGCSSTKVFKCMENRISQDMQNRRMTLNVSQGHRKCLYSRGYISLPITGCSNDVCILHRFWDVVTYFPKLKEVTWPLAHTFRGWCS